MKNEQENTLKFLRGFFREIYVGGSTATEMATSLKLSPNDTDIFILGPRLFETWAIATMLEKHFDVVCMPYNDTPCYKIPMQFKRVICSKDEHTYDLIFVDCTIRELVENTASAFSRMYYRVGYRSNILSLAPESKELLPSLLEDLYTNKLIKVDILKSTEQHIDKLKERGLAFGFEVQTY